MPYAFSPAQRSSKSSSKKPEANPEPDEDDEEIRKAQDRMKALAAEIDDLNKAKEKKKRQKEERVNLPF